MNRRNAAAALGVAARGWHTMGLPMHPKPGRGARYLPLTHAMHAINFMQDLAVIMLVSGVVTVVFHRLHQPVVLGYIVAGVIIGPHTPPFEFIHDEQTIRTLAELGLVFLLFSLGLEFSLKKLSHVGATALVAALTETVLMVWIGYGVGRLFGWKTVDAIFLGAMIAISSTTIIVKVLDELGMKKHRFAQLIFGILIVEDVLAIGMIALLSGLALSGTLSAGVALASIGRLLLFIVVALVIGVLVIPRLLAYVSKYASDEMLLVTVLGILFGFCLLVLKLGYSTALGAFLIGAIMAGTRQRHTVERLIEPLRDMFSAIFFVTIGLLLDPHVLVDDVVPILVVAAALVFGKVVAVSLGSFAAGRDGRSALRVGMGMAQIGEFSFIIASLGVSLKVASDFLYSIAVGVSIITTVLSSHLIRVADPLSARIAAAVPPRVAQLFGLYTQWLQSIQPQGNQAVLARIVQKILLQVLVNLALVAAAFLLGAYFLDVFQFWMGDWIKDAQVQKSVVWGGAMFVSLPFLIAAYRKLKALSMLLAELGVKPKFAGQYTEPARRVLSEIIPLASIVGILLMLSALSSSILPPTGLLVLVLVVTAGLALLLWQRFVKLHSRLQIALMESLEDKEDSHPS
jgi:CPA2 family monovalent cation:H+ antiporter-2